MSHEEIFVRTTRNPASRETAIVTMATKVVLLLFLNFEALFSWTIVQTGLRCLFEDI